MATKIYSGKEPYAVNQIYLIDNGKIYKGKYSISSEEIIDIRPEGIFIVGNKKIFKDHNANSSEQIMSVSKKNIYKGKSMKSVDHIGFIDGDELNDDEFAKIIYLLAKNNNLL